MNRVLFTAILLASSVFALAQYPGGGARRAGAQGMNIGHFYGKVVDSKTGKPVSGVSVQLTGNKFDTITKQLKQAILKTAISQNNGDFSLEGISLIGNFKIKMSAIGFKTLEQPVSFGIQMPQPGTTPDMQKMAAMADKDLGNFKLESTDADLGNVTVTSTVKPLMELGIDRKIFNVDKNLTSTGQTATEIMKSIPSLSVDIDGNVSLRNAAPTLFIDGRPTTLTLDQIPADIIDKVEIITNPSAKYDASGGNAGILNIVLKKNRKNGYNGNIRTGIDSRARVNVGGDLNYRQGKINFTGSGTYNQRKSISNSITNTTRFGTPNTFIGANNDVTSKGYFGFFRGGLDYFIDNRNTLSITGNYTRGNFDNESMQKTDSTQTLPYYYSINNRTTNSGFNFKNYGGQLSFKHNFMQTGHTLSADFNYNSATNNSGSNINSITAKQDGSKYPLYLQNSTGYGTNRFFTAQSDYENQLTDDSKLEAGIRVAARNFTTQNLQYLDVTGTGQNFLISERLSARYKFQDAVYAAYTTYSFKVKKTSFQLGLRAESSDYTGNLIKPSGADSTSFKVNYALSLFPSAFITHKLTEKQDLQINYSRRINRPNFFQLIPARDFATDPINPSVGNPNLRPEFTNSFEFSYNNAYKKGSNFLATAYFKYSTDLITRYSFRDPTLTTPASASDTLFTSYVNANNSYTYGLELTNRLPLTKWWEFTVNLNLYNSKINATIPDQTFTNSIVSWFAKVNNNFKLSKTVSLQLSGEGRSKTLIPQSNGGGGGGRGGGMFGGGPQASAQGYTLPRYFDVDVAIRKDWTWKKGQSGSLTLSMNDIFRTKVRTHTESNYFVQDAERLRDPPVLRLNFSYRFGKFDVNLFKRKSTKADPSSGMDMLGGG